MRRAVGWMSMVVIGLVACNAILGNEASITYVDGDALAPDRRPSEDAAADAGDANDLDASAPDPDVSCDAAAFCSDFDPPSATFPFGWDKGNPNDAAAFPLDTADFVTGPNALMLSFPGAGQGRFLATSIDGGRPFELFFDLFIRARGTATLQVLQIACRSSTTLRVFIDPSGIASAGPLELWADTQVVKGPAVRSGEWTRLALVASDSETVLYVLEPQPSLVKVSRSCLGPFTVSLGVLAQTGNESRGPSCSIACERGFREERARRQGACHPRTKHFEIRGAASLTTAAATLTGSCSRSGRNIDLSRDHRPRS